jgi:hypothetical protein
MSIYPRYAISFSSKNEKKNSIYKNSQEGGGCGLFYTKTTIATKNRSSTFFFSAP